MKKLLLLFIAVTAFSCTEDNEIAPLSAEEPNTEPFEVVYFAKACQEGLCENAYKVFNHTGGDHLVTVRFNFDRVDSQSGLNYVELMQEVNAGESKIIEFQTEEITQVEGTTIQAVIVQ